MVKNTKPSCLFIHDFKFLTHEDTVYGDGQFEYNNLWKKKYLAFFDKVTVLARGDKSTNYAELSDKFILSGDKMRFKATPSLASLKGIFSIKKVKKVLEREIGNHDIVIVRLPSMQGLVACKILEKRNKPYIVESVGNAFNALWYHDRLKGKIMASFIHLLTKWHIRKANNVIYVTNDHLQKAYPNKKNTLACSDVIIESCDEEVLKKRLKKIDNYGTNQSFKLGLVGSYDIMYKGHDVAIKAISTITKSVQLHLLGSGDSTRWSELAKHCNVTQRVFFDKPVNSGTAMVNWLDSLDILLMPSRQEGMPRVLIEAMSRGLVVVGTAAGDIPYVLDEHNVFKIGDWHGVGKRINLLLGDKRLLRETSISNFNKSKNYKLDILADKRSHYMMNIINKVLK